jgi:hypothetical protein
VSGVSTIETDLRFSGREDFWIIVAARSEDETGELLTIEVF